MNVSLTLTQKLEMQIKAALDSEDEEEQQVQPENDIKYWGQRTFLYKK